MKFTDLVVVAKTTRSAKSMADDLEWSFSTEMNCYVVGDCGYMFPDHIRTLLEKSTTLVWVSEPWVRRNPAAYDWLVRECSCTATKDRLTMVSLLQSQDGKKASAPKQEFLEENNEMKNKLYTVETITKLNGQDITTFSEDSLLQAIIDLAEQIDEIDEMGEKLEGVTSALKGLERRKAKLKATIEAIGEELDRRG